MKHQLQFEELLFSSTAPRHSAHTLISPTFDPCSSTKCVKLSRFCLHQHVCLVETAFRWVLYERHAWTHHRFAEKNKLQLMCVLSMCSSCQTNRRPSLWGAVTLCFYRESDQLSKFQMFKQHEASQNPKPGAEPDGDKAPDPGPDQLVSLRTSSAFPSQFDTFVRIWAAGTLKLLSDMSAGYQSI